MIIYTDDIEYANAYFPQQDFVEIKPETLSNSENNMNSALFADRTIFTSETSDNDSTLFSTIYMVKVSDQSHYDLMIELCQKQNMVNENIIILAGSGKKHHGLKNRSWQALPGNLHLVAYLRPERPIADYGPGFMAMAANSVVMTIDKINGFKNRAGIKWVNDVFIDGAKVCGVLAYSQSMGNKVTDIILGIGLNVETTPEIESTPFVPKAISLKELSNADSIRLGFVFANLIRSLEVNYNNLVAGKYHEILEFYAKRSLVIGREIVVYHSDSKDFSDDGIISRGKVERIGKNLELYLEGVEEPITDGRLTIKNL